MKEEKAAQDCFRMVQKELATLTERVECLDSKIRELKELKDEIKGLKLFIGRMHPELQIQLPDIARKVSGRR